MGNREDFELNTIEEAIEDIKHGKVVIVVDDEDRENEGDFVCAAEVVTPEIINFMAREARGLICTPIEESRADDLKLDMMVRNNSSLHETAFTVSIDLIGHGCTTGISSYDRATGIKALTNPKITYEDFARPGHIFPLKAKTGGVLRRTGHTEAAVDLAKLAGFYPAGVVVEILNEDGTMARLPELVEIAKKYDLKIITIEDLVEYRMKKERIIKRELCVTVPSKYGDFDVYAYTQVTNGDIHLAVKKGSWKEDEPVLVRVHSATETGDLLGILFDDNASLLDRVMARLSSEKKGVLLFMRHSENKQYILQTLERLAQQTSPGVPVRQGDQRDFGVGAQILRDLNITKMKLLRRTERKRIGLIGYGLEIVEEVCL